MQTSSAEQQLQEAVARLPNEVKPDKDLWRGIELSLEKPVADTSQSAGKRPVWLASAASFALIATLGWFAISPQPQGPSLSDESAALVQSLSAQHQSHVDALLVKFEGQEAITENWQQQMQELDNAAAAIKAALREDPANTALLQMLQHIYQQQITLIERVHAPKWQQI